MDKEFLFVWLITALERGDLSPCQKWRYAGALEVFLIEKGVFKMDEKIEYLSGGKVYFPLILDFRWKETYPQMILRKAKEYLKNEFQTPIES